MKKQIRMRHSLSAICVVIGSIVFLYLLCIFPKNNPSPVNICLYLCLSVGVPVLFIFFCWRRNILKVLSAVAGVTVILVAVLLFYFQMVFTDTSIENYLCEDTKFTAVAASYLPSGEELDSAESAQYLHKWSNTGDEYIQLQVVFSEDEYNKTVASVEKTLSDCIQNPEASYWYQEGDDLMLDSNVYRSLLFNYEHQYFAFAYATDEHSRSITYLLFSCDELSFMSVDDAFDYCC